MKKTYPLWIILAAAMVAFAILAAGGTIFAFIDIASFALVFLMSFFLSLSHHGIQEIGSSFRVAFSNSTEDKAQMEKATRKLDPIS